MKKFRIRLTALFMLLLVGGYFSIQHVALADNKDEAKDESNERLCPVKFEATVHQGPNAEKFSLNGVLKLKYKGGHGEVEGKLTLDSGVKIPVHGQLFGRAANLTFELSEGVSVIGVGTLFPQKSEDGCTELSGGGIFTGPNAADVGSWDIIGFFGGGGTPQPVLPPAIINPHFFNGRIEMDVKGSNIKVPGAKLTVTDPFTGASYGTFDLIFDPSGTLFTASYTPSAVNPVGACRVFVVTNSNGLKSSPVTLCR